MAEKLCRFDRTKNIYCSVLNSVCANSCCPESFCVHIMSTVSAIVYFCFCFSFLPSFLESMSLCISASSGQLVSYFTLSQYLLVSFSMMTATSAMTLFHYGCMYVNLCYFNIRLHFTVYCHVSNISSLCSISVSVVFNIFFLVISD